jgi:hypothetical protein
MSRLYTVEFEGISVTTANGDHDLFELISATNKPIQIEAISLTVSSELAEAQEEWLRLRVIRGHTTVGTGGTTTTPRPVRGPDTAAGFTAATVRTVIASAGSPVMLHSDAMNVRAGYQWGPVPEEFGLGASGTEYLVVRLMAAVTDDIVMSGTVYVREYP